MLNVLSKHTKPTNQSIKRVERLVRKLLKFKASLPSTQYKNQGEVNVKQIKGLKLKAKNTHRNDGYFTNSNCRHKVSLQTKEEPSNQLLQQSWELSYQYIEFNENTSENIQREIVGV
jgi:hypothetical protein